MSNYRKHAFMEFKAAGWLNDDNEFKDEMQGMICEHVLKLLDVFDGEGHSGSSAPYAINLFSTLAKFEPVVPLTGEDWEWTALDYGDDIKYQNKRCSHVFKGSDGRAYDIEGRIFYEWVERPLDEDDEGYPGVRRYKSHYTGRDSRVYIDFPYTPKREYIEKVSDAE